MKTRMLNWIAVPVVALGISADSHASVLCLSPDPVCATVLLGGLVTGVAETNGERDLQRLRVTREPETLAAIVHEVERVQDERLALRIEEAARYRPGYGAIVDRFEHGRYEGRRSLESLMDFDPGLFDDLDRIAAVIGAHHSRDVMAETYGPRRLEDGRVNWERYAQLARDALALHHNFYANGQ